MLRIYGLRAQLAVFMRIYAAYIRICDRLKLIIFVETLKWRKLDNITDAMKMIQPLCPALLKNGVGEEARQYFLSLFISLFKVN